MGMNREEVKLPRGGPIYFECHPLVTNFAFRAGVFNNNYDCSTELARLLTSEEWQKLKGITDTDMGECKVIYLELAAILSLYATKPFGYVTGYHTGGDATGSHTAGEGWPGCMESVPSNFQQNWVTGCLLQRSGISPSRLLSFCANTLRYAPALPLWRLECTREHVESNCRTVLEPSFRSRQLLLGLDSVLTGTVSAASYARITGARPSVIKAWCTSARSGLRRHQGRFVREKEWTCRSRLGSEGQVYRRHQGRIKPFDGYLLFPDDDAGEKITNLLGEDWNKLDGIPANEFLACSLAYFEIGTVIERYIYCAFGTACDEVLNEVAKALHNGKDSMVVRGWIAGCLLQYAEVSIQSLIQFCTHDLNYKPFTTSSLECLKRLPVPCRELRRIGWPKPSERLVEVLPGLHEKISIAEVFKLSLEPSYRKMEYLLSGSASKGPPLPAREAPSMAGPQSHGSETCRGETNGTTEVSQTEVFQVSRNNKRKGTQVDQECLTKRKPRSTVNQPPQDIQNADALMYCRPNDVIEYVTWVESVHRMGKSARLPGDELPA